MQELDATLARQTSRMNELQRQAESEPTVASLDALASIAFERGETLAALGRTDEAIGDQQLATSLLTQIVAGAGRVDLVPRMRSAGERLRTFLQRQGRGQEASVQALGEAQLLSQLGEGEQALRQVDPIVAEAKAALEATRTEEALEFYVQAATIRAGILYALQRLDEALATENESVVAVASFGAGQEPFLCALRTNRALTLGALGRTDEAQAELLEVIGAYDEMLASLPDADTVGGTVRAHNALADLLFEQGRADEAVAALQRAATLAEPFADDAEVSAQLRSIARKRTSAARAAGQLDEALQHTNTWCALAQTQAEANSTMENVEEMLEAAYDRAVLLHETGRHDLALLDAGNLVSAWEQLAGQQSERPELEQRVLMGLDVRERALSALGRHDEALVDQSRIVDTFRRMLRMGAAPQLQQGLAMTLQHRAATHRALGNLDKAQADLQEAQRLGGGVVH